MASVKLIEPKKKPRYYQITANVLVNGKSNAVMVGSILTPPN